MLCKPCTLFNPLGYNIRYERRKSDEFKKWLQLEKRRDQEAWEMYPSMVNAYFNPPANEVRLYSCARIFF